MLEKEIFIRNCKLCGKELTYSSKNAYQYAERKGTFCRSCSFTDPPQDCVIFYKIEITQNDINRFWEKVDIKDVNECWNWIAGRHVKGGYGKFSIKRNGKAITFVASRLAYLFYYNEINDDLLICHKCDNPSCVNPNHLFEGTESDNQQDCIKKGRKKSAHGEQMSNLTQNIVDEIRFLVNNGMKQIDVARKFNVGKNTIWHIVHYNTWKDIYD